MGGDTDGKSARPPVGDTQHIHQGGDRHGPDDSSQDDQYSGQRRNPSKCLRDAESDGSRGRFWRQGQKDLHRQAEGTRQ